MPTNGDLPTLDQISASDIQSDDLVEVFDKSLGRTRAATYDAFVGSPNSSALSRSYPQTITDAQKQQMGENWPETLARYVEFEDDFERADTAGGTISDSADGFVYEVRPNGSAAGTVKILNGEVTQGLAGGTSYFGGQPIAEKVYNIGADCIWRASSAGTGSNFTQGVFLIKNNDAWLSNFIHVRFSRSNVVVEIAESGGAAGLETLGSFVVPQDPIATFDDHWLPLDEKIRVEAVITGDRIQVFMGGWMAADVTDPRIGSLNGNYVYWEHFGGGDLDDMFIDRVWVNDFRENGTSKTRYQVASETLSKLAAGILDLHSHATLRKGNLTLQEGDVRASKLRGRSQNSGLTGAYAPALVHYGAFDDFLEPVANSASANDEDIWTDYLNSNTLDEVGSMVEIHAIGKLANAESKDIAFRMAASVTATTSLSDGNFTIDAYIHRTTSKSHNVFVKITFSDGSVVMDSFDLNNGSATTFALAIRATAATAGSVTLQKVWGVMHHVT